MLSEATFKRLSVGCAGDEGGESAHHVHVKTEFKFSETRESLVRVYASVMAASYHS